MNTRLTILATLALLVGLSVSSNAEEGPAKQIEQQRQERADYRQTLDTIMLEEGRDADWATVVETDLKSSLTKVGNLDLAVLNVACGSTLCRVILDHKTLDGQQDVLRETAGSPGFRLAGKAHLEWDDDGSARSYVYLLRSEKGGWPVPPSAMR